MNNKKMIQLLSVLLLIALMLVGCADGSQNPLETESTQTEETKDVLINVEKPHEKVEAKQENFFKLSSAQAWDVIGNAKRYEGTLVDAALDANANGLIVLRTADIDVENVVTEVFSVYNTELKTEVLSVTNTYKNGDYSTFDWDIPVILDENVKLPETVVNVSVEQLPVYYYEDSVSVIKVSKAKITPIDEEIREENSGCVYDVALSYEFYDVTGKEIAKTNSDNVRIDDSLTGDTSVAYLFGSVYAVFDAETEQVLRIVNGDTDAVIAGYDAENETYGYFFGYDYYTGISFVEVYSKASGNRILRYHFERTFGDVSQFLLNDGDILIQYVEQLPEESNEQPEYVDSFGSKFRVDHILLDIETGMQKALDLGFVVEMLYTHDELADVPAKGFEITEHVVNFAIVRAIADGKLENTAVRILDNDCTVMYEMDPLVPEHAIFDWYSSENLLGFVMLESGDFLVDIENVISSKAIVSADGKLRAYLPEGAEVVGEYIVTEKAVYDYDMKPLYVFEDNACEYAFSIGNRILVTDRDDALYEEGFEMALYELSFENGTFVWGNAIYGTDVVNCTEDYFIVYDGKYKLYNADLEHVMTTANELFIYEFDGRYLAHTVLEQNVLLYTFD